MENKIDEIEKELAHVKLYIEGLNKLLHAKQDESAAVQVFAKSTNDFNKTTQEKLIELEDGILELHKIQSDNKEDVYKLINKLTDMLTSSVTSINLNISSLLELIKAK